MQVYASFVTSYYYNAKTDVNRYLWSISVMLGAQENKQKGLQFEGFKKMILYI